MKKKLVVLGLSMIAIFSLISSIVLAASVLYTDLPVTHWAYQPISEMTEKKVLSGYPDGTFAPENSITRAEFAKILVLALSLSNGSSNNSTVFQDVPATHWAYQYVKTASEYLTGYKNGDILYYLPNDKAIREDMAIAVVNAAGLQDANYSLSTLDQFSDKIQISENLKKYVAIAVENGLMRGNANGTFNPKGHLTRAEVSQLMVNTLQTLEKIAIIDIEPSPKVEPNKPVEESESVTGIKLEKENLELIEQSTEQLSAEVQPAGATNKNITWISSNAKVATVDKNGKITAVGKGTAIITAKTEDGNKTATCIVKVNAQETNSKNIVDIAKQCMEYYVKNRFQYSQDGGAGRLIPPYDSNGAVRQKEVDGAYRTDSSTYVSWVIYEYAKANGYTELQKEFTRQHTSYDFQTLGEKLKNGVNTGIYQYFQLVQYGIPENNFKNINNKLQAGDILVYREGGHHVEIYSGKDDLVYSYGTTQTKVEPSLNYTRRSDATCAIRLVKTTTATKVQTGSMNSLPTLSKTQLKALLNSWLKVRYGDKDYQWLMKNVFTDETIDKIISSQNKYKVSPIFMLAVAVYEQNLGLSNTKIAIAPACNLFSIEGVDTKYGSGSGYVLYENGKKWRSYGSYGNAFEDFADLIANRSSEYFKKGRYTIDEIGAVYARGTVWSQKVVNIINEIELYL